MADDNWQKVGEVFDAALRQMERGPAASSPHATTVLQEAATGDARQTTAATRGSSISLIIKQHKPFAAVALVALLIALAGLGYYVFLARGTAAINAGGKKSIAVLPLKPLNTANRDELYEMGIADSLIHRLNLLHGFFARPLSATRQYADLNQDPIAAGKEQQADYVLAANYQVAGGKIRVTAQFFNVSTGQLEDTYRIDREMGDIFVMQDAIAGEVGKRLQARFATVSSTPAAKRGTTNEEAYRLYLQGRNLTMQGGAEDYRKAIECFEQAIKLDPNYALAYATMAHAHHLSFLGDNASSRIAEVKEIVKKALELDNNLAEAYMVLGEIDMIYEYDFPAAEKTFSAPLS